MLVFPMVQESWWFFYKQPGQLVKVFLKSQPRLEKLKAVLFGKERTVSLESESG